MIDEIFRTLAEKEKYKYLQEQKLVRSEDKDTFFVGASIMAHMDIFETSDTNTQKYYTVQRVFSATRLDDVGYYPLSTAFEVMMSIFRVNDSSVKPSILFILDFLKKSINVDTNEIIFLAPSELDIRNTLIDIGIDEKNIITWSRNIVLDLGSDKNQGLYLKMFIRYKNGIIPCATLGYIDNNGKINVDSALFLERLDFVKEGLDSWYEGKYFKLILAEIEKVRCLSKLKINEKYMWASYLRTLLALYEDGLKSSSKGKGNVLNKLLRLLASTIVNEQVTFEEFRSVIEASSKSLNLLGYRIDNCNDAASELYTLLTKFKTQLDSVTNKFNKWFESTPIDEIKEEDLENWRSEKGVPKKYIENLLKEKGSLIYSNHKEKKFWFRNECYKFDKKYTILNPIDFIRNSEMKRLRGRR